ncbi:MAG: response regulator [Endomicrobiales bacterium]|jgi:two-component system response regulator (stage 0 sporulation protein F)
MARGTILIIDDQQGIRESMAGILELEGFEVYSFGNAAAGIALAKSKRFDMIFLDVKMPVISGIDAFKEIHKIQPATVVYMMSALCGEDDLVQEVLREGASGCINKPFNMDEVLNIVNTYTANHI